MLGNTRIDRYFAVSIVCAVSLFFVVSPVTFAASHVHSSSPVGPKGIILPQLKSALTVKGKLTGDLVMMNYYDPYQNICPNTVAYIQKFNKHLASDMHGFGIIADVFTAFGGSVTPNPNICRDTWMCSIFKNIHATNKGYSVIANTFENGTGY